jgi:protein involved in polysaccharide export with SLBB domain
MKTSNNAYTRCQRFLTSLLCLLFILAPVTAIHAESESESSNPPDQLVHKTKKIETKSAKADSSESNYPTLVIGPGDILFITVYGENGRAGSLNTLSGGDSQLPTDYQVDSDGTITYPFLGSIHLIGLTPAQASEKIATLLHKPRKVSVLVKESNTFWVSILGNVSKPGKYQIKGAPTLLSALAEAGGPLPDSDLGGTILIHDNTKTKVDLGKLLQGEGLSRPYPYLYPGDALMVQRSGWPSLGEFAIVASILASGAVLAVELNNLHH